MGEAITWIPAMDIYELDDNYVLNAELPGVDERHIRIDFSGPAVTIRGELKVNIGCGSESYSRLEGHRGRFHRTFSLPEPVDRSGIRTEFKNGILHVVLPKTGRKQRVGQ